MVIEDTIIAQPPNVFTESEIQDLLAMVRAGEEVGRVVLEQNARNAQCLVFARKGSCLVGVAALKNPQASYRQTIKTKARVAVEAQDFPFELGYIFVRPTARLQ